MIARCCCIAMFCARFCFVVFSSRRRHTRYWRDWSSDVCSSDLVAMVRTWAAPTEMSLTWRSKLALLVSLGPTPTRGAPGAGWARGALFLAPEALLAPEAPLGPILSGTGAAPLAVLTVLVFPGLPPLQPASNRADRAARAIRLMAGRTWRGDWR